MPRRAIKQVTVSDLRRRPRWVRGLAEHADVVITKRGIAILVMLSVQRYRRLVRNHQRPMRAGTDCSRKRNVGVSISRSA